MHLEGAVLLNEPIQQRIIVRHVKTVHCAITDLLSPCVKRLKRNAQLMKAKSMIVQAMRAAILHLFHNTRDINDSTHTGHAIL